MTNHPGGMAGYGRGLNDISFANMVLPLQKSIQNKERMSTTGL